MHAAGDTVALLHVVCTLALGHNGANKVGAKRGPLHTEEVKVLPVGRVQRHMRDLDEDLAGAGLRRVYLLELRLALPLDNHGLHLRRDTAHNG